MKSKIIILTPLILISIVCQIKAQELRELTASSSCNGSGLKSAMSDYNIGYSYRDADSTLIISGYLGYENCGIEHVFTAQLDSNKVVLSEVIIDTLLATCTCSKMIKMEIDSFYYDQFTVEFNGSFLTDIPSIKQENNFRIYPNPTNGIIKVDFTDLSMSTEIDLIDSYGRIIKSNEMNGQNAVEFDLSNYVSGLYLIRINELNLTRLLIKN